jgi:hypothetical protein
LPQCTSPVPTRRGLPAYRDFSGGWSFYRYPPGDGVLTVRLDPLPTRRATTAIAELCEHLTATHTRYPGTNLILRYEIKSRR